MVILNSSAINKISCVHAVGTPRIGIAAITSSGYMHCVISSLIQSYSESDKLSGKYNYLELLSRCVRLMKSHSLRT